MWKDNIYSKSRKDGKTEQIYTEYLDESIVDLLLEKILETESKYEDTYLDINKNNTIDEEVNIDISMSKTYQDIKELIISSISENAREKNFYKIIKY